MDPLFLGAASVALGVMWWRHFRRSRAEADAPHPFAEDLQVALAVAEHEADVRKHGQLRTVHLLFALLQDEAIRTGLVAAKVDPADLERQVDAALDDLVPSEGRGASREAWTVLQRASMTAGGASQPVSCKHVMASLLRQRDDETLSLMAAAGREPLDILFSLIHGEAADTSRPDARELEVILVNDDFTTMEFVVRLLRTVFELDGDAATARMQDTHTTGWTSVGRYPATEARRKAAEATALARAHHYPLWVRLQ